MSNEYYRILVISSDHVKCPVYKKREVYAMRSASPLENR